MIPLRGYVAMGGFFGAVWYIIKDIICLPHGQNTYERYLLAHGLMGGIIISCLYNPGTFIYGCFMGISYGSFKDLISNNIYPRNF